MIVAFLPKLAEALRAVLPVFAISLFGGRNGGDRTELIVPLLGVLGGFGAIGAYVTTRFEVADAQIVHRSGWIMRRDRRIPLAQIQNVNLRQGLLERLLKVVTVEVETAAGKGAELRLSVLSEPEAERLRVELMAEAAHPHEATRDEDVYRMTTADLWLGAVTEHHAVAFLFSALPFLGGARLLAATAFWSHLPLLARIVVGGLAAILGLAAGWTFGAVQYVLRYGGFTVRREPGTTRVVYGLLTKVQVAIRPARIEYALVTSTPWQRLVGREALSVGTAGAFGDQGRIAKLALMMPRAATPAALAAVLPGLDLGRLAWRPFPTRYPLVILARGVLGLLFTSALAALFYQARGVPLRWIFVVLPFVVLGSTIDRLAGARKAAYAVDEGFLAVRQGFFRRRTEFMPMARLEVVMLEQAPWWRRGDYFSLVSKAMVHAVGLPIVPGSAAREIERTVEDAARRRRESAVLLPD